MENALASELNVLAHMLSRIALANRHTCDFTLNGLGDAIAEVAANFPVYRTYISRTGIPERDRKYIEQAVNAAKRRTTAAETSVFDFLADALLTRIAEGYTGSYRNAVIRFAMKFQQFTSVVMAKGMEDTCFYRFNRLTSLNEVGGDPRLFGVDPETFHEKTLERAKYWPHSMLATSTHDSKRSEDVRARINLLSEIPAFWRSNVRRWHKLNHSFKKMVDGYDAPSRNDEYLYYQTLLGAWPLRLGAPTDSEFRTRIENYMLKAIREAKERTSWANQNVEYEKAVSGFVAATLGSPAFLNDFLSFEQYVARLGLLNSLSQTLIKLASPGVPDIYQGTELWDFSLVDPDNRRPVDYALRTRLLHELQQWQQSPEQLAARVREISQQMLSGGLDDGRVKLYATSQTLRLRREHAALFQEGAYLPLQVVGEKADHVFAFARHLNDRWAVVAVPRLCAKLLPRAEDSPLDSAVWKQTALVLPANASGCVFRNVFTGEPAPAAVEGRHQLQMGTLFANFPAALLLA
jgi:(1->4)-alpha-D-glucan 1-alpha-D-glucosylmutase